MDKIISICVIFICGCGAQDKGLFEFKPIKGGLAYRFKAPVGYLEKKYLRGDNESQIEFWYRDSSVFFVTTFKNTYNYEEIRKQGTYYDRFKALNSGDTITLQGIDENGLRWKDKLIGKGIIIGYSRVLPDRLAEFERAVSSIKKKGKLK